jgi:hypothetical protein
VLADQKTLPTSGIVVFSYSVPGGAGAAPRIGYIKTRRARPNKKSSLVGKLAPTPRRTPSKKKRRARSPKRLCNIGLQPTAAVGIVSRRG